MSELDGCSADGASARKHARVDGASRADKPVMLDTLIHLAGPICAYLHPLDVLHLGRCCSALASATAGDHVWLPQFESHHVVDLPFVMSRHVDSDSNPSSAASAASCDSPPPPSWRTRFERWTRVQRAWRTGRAPHVRLKLGHGPIFFTGHAGEGVFIASGDGTVRALSVCSSGAGGAACDVAGETRARWRVMGEVAGTDAGMLGGSIDAAARTVCTGSFTGEVSLFASHVHEVADVSALSVKRLKSALAARSIPFDDLVEKREFVDRVKLYNALPALERVAVIGRHEGAVIGCSHSGDLLATCGQDAVTKLWSISTRKCVRTLDDPHETGVDAVFYDPRHARVFTGNKAATVGMWSAETGALVHEWYPNTGWVWCVKSATNYASSSCVEVGQREGYPGDGNLLLAGTVEGVVHVFDVRANRAIRAINLQGLTGGEGDAAVMSDAARRRRALLGGDAQSAPVTGLIPMFAHSRLVTAGFDGCVRVLDLRTYGCLWCQRVTDSRLARCDVANDCIAVGDMDGYLHLLDMNPWRL